MSLPQARAHTFPVGNEYSCRMTFDPERHEVRSYWAPCPPPKMTRRMQQDYRHGRDELLSQTGLRLIAISGSPQVTPNGK